MSNVIDLHQKCFVALYQDYCFTLDAALTADANSICLSTAKLSKLCAKLGPNGYTRLVISDGVDFEIVAVETMSGDVVIHRAQEDTQARSWRCGSRIRFDWTPCNMLDQADLAKDKMEKEKEEEAEQCGINCVLCWGNYDLTVKDGKIIDKECVRHLPKGQTRLSVLEWNADGCIVSARDGQYTHRPVPKTSNISNNVCRTCGD